MLDPLTAISLASSVIQFTDFCIRLVAGSIEVYQSTTGVNSERSNLELKITHVRNLADKVFPTSNTTRMMGLRQGTETSCGSLQKPATG